MYLIGKKFVFYSTHHHGRMDERDQLSHSYRLDMYSTPILQEFTLLLDVFGVSALVDSLNNLPLGKATVISVLGPLFTEDAPDGSSFDLLTHLLVSPTRIIDNPTTSIYSPAWRIDRVGMEGRVHVYRGTRARFGRRAHSGAAMRRERGRRTRRVSSILIALPLLFNGLPLYVSTRFPTI